ncbi:hypothetical protein ANTRET_LOCUS9388 [Anthophora retusa]
MLLLLVVVVMKSFCFLFLTILVLAARINASSPIANEKVDRFEIRKNEETEGKVVRVKRAPFGKLALLAGAAGLLGKKALLLGGAAIGVKALVGAGIVGAGLYKAKYYGGGYESEYKYDTPSVYLESSSWD